MTPSRGSLFSTVHKYVVSQPDAAAHSYVEVPHGAQLVSVDLQNDEMVVWALVPLPSGKPERRTLIVVNTGHTFQYPPGAGRFLGTVRTASEIVWHVWEANRV